MPDIKRFLRNHESLFLALQPVLIKYRLGIMKRAQKQGIQKNKAVFASFDFRSYNDNTRFVSEKLHEMRPECDIVWLARDVEALKKVVPPYVRAVGAISREAYQELATARVWVDNFSKRNYLKYDRARQFYINTWHGDRPFKKIVYDTNPPSPYRLEEDADLMVCGCDYGEKMYRSAFHYRGEVMKDGCPRNDILLRHSPEDEAAVRRELHIPDGAKLLLYAPTFRLENMKNESVQDVNLDLTRVLDALEKKTGETWLCLYRTHYFVPSLSVKERDDRLIDVTKYGEMASLMLTSDMLLTDYSSCAGDFALLGRPILLYLADKADYAEHDRGLYFDPADSPFWSAASPEEMDRLIGSLDFAKAKENCDEINRFFGNRETGHGAESVARYILDKMDMED